MNKELAANADDEKQHHVDEIEQAEKRIDLQIVDDNWKYMPSVEEAYDPKHSQMLLDKANEAYSELEDEYRLGEQKEVLLPGIHKALDAVIPEPSLDFTSPAEFEHQLQQVLIAHDSDRPYQEVSSLISVEPFETFSKRYLNLDSFASSSNIFRIREKLKAALGGKRRKKYQTRIDAANEQGKELTKSILTTMIMEIDNTQEQLREEMDAISTTLNSFYNSDADSLEENHQELLNNISRYKQLAANMQHLRLICEVCKDYEDQCDSHIRAKIFRIIHLQNGLDEQLARNGEYLKIDDSRVWSRLGKLPLSISSGLYKLFESREIFKLEHNRYHVPMEYQQTIVKIRTFMEKVQEKSPHTPIPDFHYPFRIGADAKNISHGRVVTHTAPTERMYDILRHGEILSQVEQEKGGEKRKRTHGTSTLNDPNAETHSICVEPEGVYHNLKNEKITILFSDNQLLSEGRQFVDDKDGMHIYGDDFRGEDFNSSGLRISLLDTPCMIMVEDSEKKDFVQFLLEESAWKDQLSALSQDEINNWIDENIIFVENGFSFNDATREFWGKTKLENHQGYVIPSGQSSYMKGGHMPTLRFIPRMDDA